jgi:hypothetical protein
LWNGPVKKGEIGKKEEQMVGESLSMVKGGERVVHLAGEKEFFRVGTDVNAKYFPFMAGRSRSVEKVKRTIHLLF